MMSRTSASARAMPRGRNALQGLLADQVVRGDDADHDVFDVDHQQQMHLAPAHHARRGIDADVGIDGEGRSLLEIGSSPPPPGHRA
jgi:hypothetical protein